MTARSGAFEELTLPTGERLLWQGRPTARALAVRVFHMRLIAAYFVTLFVGRVVSGGLQQESWPASLASASRLLVPFAVATVLLAGLALLYSRTTRYSVTSRRVLLQFGAVLPMTLNVPLTQVASAAVRTYRDGSGDLPLAVTSEQRLAFLLLWPHVRPWRLARVEPMLRCVPNARDAAKVLAEALLAASPRAPEPAAASMSVPSGEAAPVSTIASAA